jgi:D-aminopeptidase
LNAITDVAGVRVGQVTLVEGDSIRTGVTAILPHGGNLFQEKVPGAIHVGNAFGKLVGATQVQELGLIETPIVLTNTLSVWQAADAVLSYVLSLPGNEDVRSVNPVVGETNDGSLNDIRGRHVKEEHVLAAIRGASPGPVAEGAVGAGTGTVAFGFKGGIGTSSRRLPESLGGYTLGVLVQSNFGGVLQMDGLPVGVELGRYYLSEALRGGSPRDESADGSIMMVVATDAPLRAHELGRLARRAMLGLGRTGSPSTHGSGDFVIAFSTAPELRSAFESESRTEGTAVLRGDALSPLFQAVVEATEEAICNSLLKATTVTGHRGRTVEALPLDRLLEIGRKYNRLHPPAR